MSHLTTKICKICSKEFKARKDRIGKFCSYSCHYEDQKESKKGKKNGNFKHGKQTQQTNREFINNIKIIKNEMMDRAGYIYCEHCGKTNAIGFHGHHLVYRSERPNHKFLHNQANILFCCTTCHGLFHRIKKTRNELVDERKLEELFGPLKH